LLGLAVLLREDFLSQRPRGVACPGFPARPFSLAEAKLIIFLFMSGRNRPRDLFAPSRSSPHWLDSLPFEKPKLDRTKTGISFPLPGPSHHHWQSAAPAVSELRRGLPLR